MKKINISRFFFAFLLLLISFGLVACGNGGENNNSQTENTESGTNGSTDEENKANVNAVVYFHYQRQNSDYDEWQIWLWDDEGAAVDWEDKDSFGVYFRVDLTDPTSDFYQATTLGYIYRFGEWKAKDKVANDRFITLTEAMIDSNNEIHLYSFEGVETIFLDKEGSKPVYEITGFMLSTDAKTVTYSANATGEQYYIYRNGEIYEQGEMMQSEGTVTLPEKFDLKKETVIDGKRV